MAATDKDTNNREASSKKSADFTPDRSSGSIIHKATDLLLVLIKSDAHSEKVQFAANSLGNDLLLISNSSETLVQDMKCNYYESLKSAMDWLSRKEENRRNMASAEKVTIDIDSATMDKMHDLIDVSDDAMQEEEDSPHALNRNDASTRTKVSDRMVKTAGSARKKDKRRHRPVTQKMKETAAQKMQCEICGIIIRRDSLGKHKKVHQDGYTMRHECEECGKHFPNPGNLKTHLRIHSNNDETKRPYKCDQCGKRYTQSNNLKTHQATHQSNYNPNELKTKCDICMKMVSKSRLKDHKRSHLADQDPSRMFTCNICGNSYKWKRTLDDHMRCHQDNEELRLPYKCTDCDKRFAFLGNLREHERTHLSDDDPRKKAECDICGKIYNSQNDLRKHKKAKHTDDQAERQFKCEECGKAFLTLLYLKYHQNVHTGNFRFNCPICTAGFNGQNMFKKHMESHKKGTARFLCKQGKQNKNNEVVVQEVNRRESDDQQEAWSDDVESEDID